MKKEINEKQLSELNGDQLEQLCFASNDGQGDTYINTLKELKEIHDCDDNVKTVDELYEYTDNNMTVPFWVENNKIIEVKFL